MRGLMCIPLCYSSTHAAFQRNIHGVRKVQLTLSQPLGAQRLLNLLLCRSKLTIDERSINYPNALIIKS